MRRSFFPSPGCISLLVLMGMLNSGSSESLVFAGRPEEQRDEAPPLYSPGGEEGTPQSETVGATAQIVSSRLLEPWTVLRPLRSFENENTVEFSELRLAIGEYLQSADGNFFGEQISIQDLKDLAEGKKSFRELSAANHEIQDFFQNLVSNSKMVARLKLEQGGFNPEIYRSRKKPSLSQSLDRLVSNQILKHPVSTHGFSSISELVSELKEGGFTQFLQVKGTIKALPVLSIPEAVALMSIFEESEQEKIFNYLLKHSKLVNNLNSYTLKQVMVLTQHLSKDSATLFFKKFEYEVPTRELAQTLHEGNTAAIKQFQVKSPMRVIDQLSKSARGLDVDGTLLFRKLFQVHDEFISKTLTLQKSATLVLDDLNGYLNHSAGISDSDFYAILEFLAALPPGFEWGYFGKFWPSLANKIPLGSWIPQNHFFSISVEIIYRALTRIDNISDSVAFNESISKVDEIIRNSQGFNECVDDFKKYIIDFINAVMKEKQTKLSN